MLLSFELRFSSLMLAVGYNFNFIVVKQDVAFPCQQHREVLLFYPVRLGELEKNLKLRTLLFLPGWFVTLANIGYSRMFFLAFTRFCEGCNWDPVLCQLDSFFKTALFPQAPFRLFSLAKGRGGGVSGPGSLHSCVVSRKRRRGACVSLAKRLYMVSRDTPCDGLIHRHSRKREGSLLPPAIV